VLQCVLQCVVAVCKMRSLTSAADNPRTCGATCVAACVAACVAVCVAMSVVVCCSVLLQCVR